MLRTAVLRTVRVVSRGGTRPVWRARRPLLPIDAISRKYYNGRGAGQRRIEGGKGNRAYVRRREGTGGGRGGGGGRLRGDGGEGGVAEEKEEEEEKEEATARGVAHTYGPRWPSRFAFLRVVIA